MALQSMTALASITLQQASASVTFSGIPQNYRDLILIINGGNTGGPGLDNIFISLNSDSSNSNYAMVQMSASGSVTSSSSESNFSRILNYYGYQQNTLNSVITTQIFDYSLTNKHKTFLTRSSNADNGVAALANRWANSAAVSSIAIAPGGGSFIAGSIFNLYGRIG